VKINKSYKFKLYPTEKQIQQLRQHGGNTRFLWNYFLNLNKQEYEKNKKFIFAYDLIMSLPKLKKECEFLKLSIAQSLQQVGRYFDMALKDFIAHKKGFPAYKQKSKQRDRFTIPQLFKIKKNYIYIPKIGKIRWKKHQQIKGKAKHIVIKQEKEHWHCSICCELKIKTRKVKISKDDIVGIDVGLKTYATMSNNETIENPKILKTHENKLKKTQRRLSKRVEGSNNKNKQRKKVAKLHRKVRNVRKDFQHKTTYDMITKYDGFILENLNIQGMMSNHKLAKSIQDCAWYSFKQKLKYKSLWHGKHYDEIDRFEPTSKKCSKCGWLNHDLTLNDRIFKCEQCGLEIDRDLNAAINIKNVGLEKILWGTQEFTLGEIGNYRTSVQCQSLSQEKERISPNLLCVN